MTTPIKSQTYYPTMSSSLSRQSTSPNMISILSIIMIGTIIVVIILFATKSCKETNLEKYKTRFLRDIPENSHHMENFMYRYNNLINPSRHNIKTLAKETYDTVNAEKIKKLIDHVVYINLPNRKDRNNETIAELEKLGLDYTRIEGVVNKFGGLGCSKAHLKALEYAKSKGFKNVLVCEDDIKFKFIRGKLYKLLISALTYLGNNYDVLMLTGGKVKSYKIPGINSVKQLYMAQTRTAYLVNSSYYDTLINNFKENCMQLERRGPSSYEGSVFDQPKGHGFAGDQYWKRIQYVDKWYIMNPKLCSQRTSFSDIQNKSVSYVDT